MSDLTPQAPTATAPTQDAVRPEIVEMFDELFQVSDGLTLQTKRADIDRWDSLQHVALVSAIESDFKISLTMDEMMEIETIGDIHAILARHGA